LIEEERYMMATNVRPRIADLPDRGVVANLLAVAFTNTPIATWLEPDHDCRLRKLREYFTLVTDWYLERGTVYLTSDGTAVAVWIRSSVEQASGPDGANALCAQIWQDSMDRFVRLEQARNHATPCERHERLVALAVDQDARSRGQGSELLAAHHTFLDRTGLPAITEAADPRAVQLLTSSGFTPGEVLAIDAGPTLQRMERFPQ
jgi:GNAT superfamily N-acetyltransferase